ncbi:MULTISPECIES: hypothetical protein [Vibrio]|uniref:hypothetical protein n=1 Tax=Vibrio TaxID=662 RepID=UPI00211B4CCF|nr:hypothetical protein [Vibrio diabolicus]MCG9618565.1 hypothetical protein [Vibrio diabolicus]|eukprot:Anaeramoba_flamelloidesa815404_32.p2 GENE.a815404_32~~a815404_32.p2  ORF type:complete len:215 (+),score=0.46 a815404_32:548-1192(+)
MKLVGLSKKKKEYPSAYYELSELQQVIYRVCEDEYEKAKVRIDNATSLLKVRERTINKSEVARIAGEKLGRANLNHSHMSKENCLFLFSSINAWNAKLKAHFELSSYVLNSKARQPTKEELKAELGKAKKAKKEFGREVLDYYTNAVLIQSEAVLKTKVAKLERENEDLNKKLVDVTASRDELLKQIAEQGESELAIKRLRKEILNLQGQLKQT